MARRSENGSGFGADPRSAALPISPPPVIDTAICDLPAYLSNGVVGLRVRPNPFAAGMMRVAGFAGEDPARLIEVGATAPYPLALDLALDRVWRSDLSHRVGELEQSYDFATGELTSRLSFTTDGCKAGLEVLTFCSRDQPSLICQEVSLRVDKAVEVAVRIIVDGCGINGRAVRALRR